MISPVSFGNTAASFNEKINRPQTYVQHDVSAATNLNGTTKKKKSAAPIVIALLAAGAAFGLTAGYRKGSFNKLIEQGGFKEKVGKVLEFCGDKTNKVGEFITAKISQVSAFVKEKLPKTADTIPEEVAEQIINAAG